MKSCNLAFALLVAATATIGMDARAVTVQIHQGADAAGEGKHDGSGVLEAVNPKAGKVKIRHGAIPSLHWPAMTMWFVLNGPLPKDVKVGDDVRFELKEVKPEEWAITRIERKH